MLKNRILGVVVLVILMIVAILGVATFVLVGSANDLYQQSSQQGASNLLNKIVANSIDRMEGNTTSMTRHSDAIAALREKNVEALKSATVGTYNRLNSGGIIDGLYLFDAQGGLVVAHGVSAGPRSQLVESVGKTSKTARGLERSANGGPAARLAFPLMQQGDLVGVAVFEKGFGTILAEMAKANASETAVMSLERTVIEATEKSLFAELSGIVPLEASAYTVKKFGAAHYGVASILLTDNEAKPLGVFMAAKDDSIGYARNVRTTWIAIGISLAVFLLSLAFLRHYIRAAFGPLDRMVAVMHQVQASGDFSVRASIHNPADEVGIASASFNELLARIAQIIHEVQQSSEAIASAAQVMASSGAQITLGTSEQSSAADAVAAAMQETTVSISETASNAVSANQIAHQAQAGIEESLAAMKEALTDVELVAGLICQASDNVVQLDGSSKKIGGIVQVIKDIADQTNLLALNAAIEAARAGEQGRGFAVVADEVRKLAESTTKATNEIAGLIGGIQSQINAAVTTMQDANTQSAHGLGLVRQTEGILQRVGADSGSAATNMRAIAEAVREQDTAVQQVANRIQHIAQITEASSIAAGEAAGTAKHLDELASRLRASVAGFRTGG